MSNHTRRTSSESSASETGKPWQWDWKAVAARLESRGGETGKPWRRDWKAVATGLESRGGKTGKPWQRGPLPLSKKTNYYD